MCTFLRKTEKIVTNSYDMSIESTKITISGNCMQFLLQSKTAFVLYRAFMYIQKVLPLGSITYLKSFAVPNHISMTQLPPLATSRQNWQNFKTAAISLDMIPILSKHLARLPVLEVQRQPIYTVSIIGRGNRSPWLKDQKTFTSTWNT